jgi:hypothetical protein
VDAQAGLAFGRKGGANHTLQFDDFNVFGSGKRLSIGAHSDVDRTSKSFLWADPNVFGTRWTTDARYSDNDDGHAASLEVERPFFSFDTRWTAGINLGSDDGVQHRYSLGHRADEFRREARSADLHFGTSRGWDDGWVRRLSAGLRFDEAKFSDASGFAPTIALPRAFAYRRQPRGFIRTISRPTRTSTRSGAPKTSSSDAASWSSSATRTRRSETARPRSARRGESRLALCIRITRCSARAERRFERRMCDLPRARATAQRTSASTLFHASLQATSAMRSISTMRSRSAATTACAAPPRYQAGNSARC